jgi:predicted GNAT family acetyltransferase
MQVAFEKNPKDFLKKYGAYLAQHEAEHNLIFSLCQTAEQRVAKGGDAGIQLTGMTGDEGVVMVAVQTPPHNLVLSRASAPDVDKLAETLANQNFRFPGIVGPSDVAHAFADKWAALTGQKPVEFMDQIIYSLTKVLMPDPVEGQMRPAKPAEAKTIAQWIAKFTEDALPKSEHLSDGAALKRAEDMIAAGRMYVWDVKGRAVAQASVSGTDAVARISMVYTPPEDRGHGYAKAVVANLSEMQLKAGKKMCCLYADARNPVSNSIYRKIGYEFVGRSSLYILDNK